MAKTKKFTKTEVRKAVMEAGTRLKDIAEHLGVTPRTARNYLDDYDLWEYFKLNKDLLKMLAAGNITAAIEQGDIDTSKWALERLGKDEGWTKRSEFTGADGDMLFKLSPEAAALVDELGLDMKEIARHFVRMIEAQAEIQRRAEAVQPLISGPDSKE